jgi:hypothetical protein
VARKTTTFQSKINGMEVFQDEPHNGAAAEESVRVMRLAEQQAELQRVARANASGAISIRFWSLFPWPGEQYA